MTAQVFLVAALSIALSGCSCFEGDGVDMSVYRPNASCSPQNRIDHQTKIVLGGFETCTETREHRFLRFFERVTKGNMETKIGSHGQEIPEDAVIRARAGDAFWTWERETK